MRIYICCPNLPWKEHTFQYQKSKTAFRLVLVQPALCSYFHFKMRFTTIASALLLAGNALAAPGTALRRERELQRRASGRKGNPMLKVDGPEGLSTNNTNVEYSSNWAGAVLIGTGYTSVTGTFTIPTPTSAGSGSVSPLSSLVPS